MSTFPKREPGDTCSYCGGSAKRGRTIRAGFETTDEECYAVFYRSCIYCQIPIVGRVRKAIKRTRG